MKTIQDIYSEFDKLTCAKKAIVLFDALDIMQQYNGRSKQYCIALAMGYETDDGKIWHK